MDKHPLNQSRTRLAAAFVLLSLVTGLVLVFTARFVALPEVHALALRLATGQRAADNRPSALPDTIDSAEGAAAPQVPALRNETGGLQAAEPGDLPERQAQPETQPADAPQEAVLSIPRLKVAQVVTTIRVRDGYWDVDPLGKDVGLLETTGAYPGDARAMVFIGHVTLAPEAAPGPFFHLYDLDPGDEITYQIGDQLYVYEMENRKVVDPKSVAELYQPGGDQMILVTCTAWDYLNFDYDKRLLIHARLVRTETLPAGNTRNDQS